MPKNKQPYRGYVKIWRVFLAFFSFTIILTLIYEEFKTTVTYTYSPSATSEWLTKRHTSPNDSPIVVEDGRRQLLLNQPETPFSVTLTDIFEELSIYVYFRSPNPQQVKLFTARGRSLPLVETDKITLFDNLSNPEWTWHVQGQTISDRIEFYAKPGLPENFPPVESFMDDTTLQRMFDRAEIFVVKNDQNIEYREFSDEFDLPFTAYLLVPKLDQMEYTDSVVTARTGQYLVELHEPAYEEIRVRGVEYDLQIALNDYQPGDWAVVDKIEVAARRQPVTVEGLINSVKRVL